MALVRVNLGINAQYQFSYIAQAAIIDKKADQAAHHFFNLGYGDHGTEETPRNYADLSLQEKLNILDAHVLRVILDASMAYKVEADISAARQAAEAAESAETI